MAHSYPINASKIRIHNISKAPMSHEDAAPKAHDIYEFQRPIKTVSVLQLEDAFSAALGSLTGCAYKVTINKLDLNVGLNAWISDTSSLELTLSPPKIDQKDAPF